MSETNVEYGNWDDDFRGQEDQQASSGGEGDSKKISWMKFEKPGKYRIRLVGNYVKFYRWWSPFTKRLITHISYKDKDKAWLAGHWPRKTFAIHVIDRSDTDEQHPTGKLKIFEKSSAIFQVFADYKIANDINPVGKEAPDFEIKVEWPNGNKRQAKYTVTPLAKITKWTEQEEAMIRDEHVDLKKMYAPSPLEKINEEWDNLPEEAKVPPKKETSQAPKQASKPIAEPSVDSNEDPLFEDENEGATAF